jgi:hypothetical protein
MICDSKSSRANNGLAETLEGIAEEVVLDEVAEHLGIVEDLFSPAMVSCNRDSTRKCKVCGKTILYTKTVLANK